MGEMEAALAERERERMLQLVLPTLERGDVDYALGVLDRALREHPGDAVIELLREEALAEREVRADARARAVNLIHGGDPRGAVLECERARVWLGTDEELDRLEEQAREEALFVKGLLKAARTLSAAGEFGEAIVRLDAADERARSDPSVAACRKTVTGHARTFADIVEAARAAERDKRWDDAKTEASRALQIAPRSKELRQLVAKAETVSKTLRAADKKVAELLEQAKFEESHDIVNAALKVTGAHPKLDELAESIAAGERRVAAALERAAEAEEKGDLEEKQKAVEEAAELAPRAPKVAAAKKKTEAARKESSHHLKQAQRALDAGDLDGAEKAFQSALDVDRGEKLARQGLEVVEAQRASRDASGKRRRRFRRVVLFLVILIAATAGGMLFVRKREGDDLAVATGHLARARTAAATGNREVAAAEAAAALARLDARLTLKAPWIHDVPYVKDVIDEGGKKARAAWLAERARGVAGWAELAAAVQGAKGAADDAEKALKLAPARAALEAARAGLDDGDPDSRRAAARVEKLALELDGLEAGLGGGGDDGEGSDEGDEGDDPPPPDHNG